MAALQTELYFIDVYLYWSGFQNSITSLYIFISVPVSMTLKCSKYFSFDSLSDMEILFSHIS